MYPYLTVTRCSAHRIHATTSSFACHKNIVCCKGDTEDIGGRSGSGCVREDDAERGMGDERGPGGVRQREPPNAASHPSEHSARLGHLLHRRTSDGRHRTLRKRRPSALPPQSRRYHRLLTDYSFDCKKTIPMKIT